MVMSDWPYFEVWPTRCLCLIPKSFKALWFFHRKSHNLSKIWSNNETGFKIKKKKKQSYFENFDLFVLVHTKSTILYQSICWDS